MIKSLLILLSLTSFTALAASADNFYECSGFSNKQEYRVGINLKSKKAIFFDNEKLSYMVQFKTDRTKNSLNFIGKDLGAPNSILHLDFDLTKQKANLISVNKNGKITKLGTVSCVPTEPWDELK